MPPLFNISRIGDHFCLTLGNREIITPNGHLILTKYRELAKLVCMDMNLYGKEPNVDKPSYVDLMMRYCDVGHLDSKDRRILGVTSCYSVDWDISVRAFTGYKEHFTEGEYWQEELNNPTLYFGKNIPEENHIYSWAQTLSMRELVTIGVLSSSFHSVLGGYYLLSGFPISVEKFVDGLLKFGKTFHFFPNTNKSFDEKSMRIWTKDFFDKAKVFAAFSDDPIIIHSKSN